MPLIHVYTSHLYIEDVGRISSREDDDGVYSEDESKAYSDKIIHLLTQWLDRVQRQYETKLFVEIDIYEPLLKSY